MVLEGLHPFGEIPLQLQVFLISLIPLLELRAAIPYGVAYGLPLVEAVSWGMLGNLTQVPFVTAIIWACYSYVDRYIPRARPLLNRIEEQVRRHEALLQRYGAIGLVIVVGIPVPGSGIWTGSILGRLGHLNFWVTDRKSVV